MNLTDIKQRFFGFRNGIVAKAFHDAGSPHSRIFGLQLPQLAAIAREAGFDASLADALWQEKDCRESRLLACYLFNPSEVTPEKAVRMAQEALTKEETDILAWRLLGRMPEAESLLPRLPEYAAVALRRNLES